VPEGAIDPHWSATMDRNVPRGLLAGDPDANADGFACPLCAAWLSAETLDATIGYDDVLSECGHLWGSAVAFYVREDGIPASSPLESILELLETQAADLLPDASTRRLTQLAEGFEAALFGHFALVSRAVGGLGSSTIQYYPFAADPRAALEAAERAEQACWRQLNSALPVLPNPFREESESWDQFEEEREVAIGLGGGGW
jgi:hypothetical protein